jgi:isoleucyl-tRNA synthetase
MDELNVKELEFVADPRNLVTYRVLPDNKLLGPRFGAQFPRVRAALAAADPASIAARVQAGLPVTLEVDGQPVELAPGEILVNTQPAEGLAVAADRLVTVAIDTALTPALRAEGLAREIVRRIQAMRKEAGFNIEDRITSYYTAGGEIAQVMVNFAGYICAETLSTALLPEQPPVDIYSEEQTVDGIKLTLGVRRNAR